MSWRDDCFEGEDVYPEDYDTLDEFLEAVAEEERKIREREEEERAAREDSLESKASWYDSIFDDDYEDDYDDKEYDEYFNDAWKIEYEDDAMEYDLDLDDYDDEAEFLEALEEAKEQECIQDEEDESNDYIFDAYLNQPEYMRYIDECDSTFLMKTANYLIKAFPELNEDYDVALTTNHTLATIIYETYEIDKDRAVRYLKWLWATFSPDLMTPKGIRFGSSRNCLCIRGDLIYWLLSECETDEYLFSLLKNDKDFLHAAFKDCVHENHDYSIARRYMGALLPSGDVDAVLNVYQYYLECQKEKYSNNDLGKLWYDLSIDLYYIDLKDEVIVSIINKVLPIIDSIGPRGTKSKKELQKLLESSTQRIEFERQEKEQEELLNGPYGWRYKVTNSQKDLVDPNKYENSDDYYMAYAAAKKAIIQRDLANRRAKLDDKNIYDVCIIYFNNSINGYCYFTGGLSLNVGDKVLVPFGKENDEIEGKVVSVSKTYGFALPCKVELIKEVLKKL